MHFNGVKNLTVRENFNINCLDLNLNLNSHNLLLLTAIYIYNCYPNDPSKTCNIENNDHFIEYLTDIIDYITLNKKFYSKHPQLYTFDKVYVFSFIKNYFSIQINHQPFNLYYYFIDCLYKKEIGYFTLQDIKSSLVETDHDFPHFFIHNEDIYINNSNLYYKVDNKISYPVFYNKIRHYKKYNLDIV